MEGGGVGKGEERGREGGRERGEMEEEGWREGEEGERGRGLHMMAIGADVFNFPNQYYHSLAAKQTNLCSLRVLVRLSVSGSICGVCACFSLCVRY